MKFGFLTGSRRIEVEGIVIAPPPGFSEIVTNFYETAAVSAGWIYGPELEKTKNEEEESRFKNAGPKITEPFFRLPPTHEITSKDHEIGIRKIRQLLVSSNKEQVKTTMAILHWFLVGQSYEFEWDRFDAQYKVLDGIYRVSGLKSSSHAQRPVDLVQHWAKYGIILPEWAMIDDGRSSKLSRMRNDLVHEAIYAAMPIRYSYPEDNYDHEFVSFNVKLIAALFQIDTPYLRAAPNDRSRWIWDMK